MMADELDQASDLELLFTEEAISKHRVTKQPLKAIGVCYNCESEIRNGAFCSKECADEYEWFHKRKKGHEVYEGAS